MDKFINNIVNELNNGNYIVVAVIVVAAIVFNLSAIVNFFDSRRKLKINLIGDALGNNNITGVTKSFLQDLIELEYFHKITGIAVEKKIREKLIQAYNEAQGKIRLSHFKRSVPYIVFRNEEIYVEIGWFEKVGFIYNILSSLLNLLGAMLLLIFTILPTDIAVANIYQGILFFSIMLALGVFFLAQSLSVISAFYVKKHLETMHNS